MTISKLTPGDMPTREQLERIEQAAQKDGIPDDDSPVYTPEQLAYLYEQSKAANGKKTIA